MNVDHRFTQTQKQYAADDLETMSEAVRYQAHVFGLVRSHLGAHVLEDEDRLHGVVNRLARSGSL